MATKEKKAAPKTRITKKQVIAHRTRVVKDHSPVWEGCAEWTIEQFMRNYRAAIAYYNLEFSGKDLKPAVLKWMAANGYDAKTVDAFKKMKDWRSNSTMGAIASCLLRGMTPQRDDFNKGRDSTEWLKREIATAMEAGQHDAVELGAIAEGKAVANAAQPSIQERVKEAAMRMTEEIEDAIEAFAADPESFDPKAFKMLNLLKGKEVKAAHARLIKGFYSRNLEELTEAATTKDEQLKEAYSHLSKANLKKITLFYQEIVSACDMLAQEAKVNRAPRAKKSVPKEKLVEKLKYMKTFEPLKLVSINPTDIIGTKELWIYNTKSRKLGRYVADDYKELGIKGTTLTGFNENTSVCKTLRKPEEKLKEFKAAGKVQLRKFLDDINATDTKMNGRINEEVILLKAST
jgi:hypothetical protein